MPKVLLYRTSLCLTYIQMKKWIISISYLFMHLASFAVLYKNASVHKLTYTAVRITTAQKQNPIDSHPHLKKLNWGCVMSPSHPGQLNTSHHGLASLKRLINPSDQPPVTIRKTSRHIGQSLHGQRRSTPTQVTGNWIARENVVCLSTWKTFVYSQLVMRPDRLYWFKNKKQRWCLMQFYKVEITVFFFRYQWCMWVIWGNYSES